MIKPRLTHLGFFRVPLAVSLPLVLATSVLAQNPAPTTTETATVRSFNENGTEEATTERVFVTGSAIPTAAEVGPNPVLNVTRDLINKSGERNTEELLRNLTVANANGVPVSNNENGSNTAVGAATIALRGFDARATLILLDGRRVAPYPTGNRRVVFVDLNTIPESAIQSIEILKDGASTTYGADAVAGVVNIKRWKDYRGAEAKFEYGNTTDKDSGSINTALTFGVGDGKTNVSGTVNYYHRNSIFNHDRDYSAVPPFLSSNASPYNLQVTNAAVAEAGGTVIPSGSGNQFASAPNGTNGLAPASTYLYGAGRPRSGPNGFNFNEFSLSFPSSERYGGYVAMDHKFLGDALVVYGDAMYQNVKKNNELVPPATGNFQSPGFTTLAIPPRVANPAGTTPFGGPTYAATGLTPGAFNPFNPFNQIISGGTRARLAEFGNRLFDNESEAWLGTIGFRGDKLFNGTWGYDTAFRYSEIKNTTTGTQVSISRFNRILNQADPIFNPASPEYIGTPVAFNPFGDFRVPIPSNAASIEFAGIQPTDLDTSKLATLDATIYTTSLFDLPAGGVGFAFGGQYRREWLNEVPDELNVAGDIAGNSPVSLANGGRRSYAFYTETSIPIFSPKNAIAAFRSLEFTAAARIEAFLNNDTIVLVPKLGIRWQPFDEQLTLRATWGEGFREPSLEELFGSPVSTLEVTHDPLKGGLLESETNTLITSNPNLQPEDSRSFSGGFVYSPKYAPGLNLSVDFWDIERTGVVTAPLAQQVLDGTAPGIVERDAGGFITRITLANQNLGSQEARGFDFGLSYQRQTPWGTFSFITQATYLDEFLFPQFIFAEFGPRPGNLAGRTTDPGLSNEGWYKWKGQSSLEWTWKGFDLVTIVRYIDGFNEFTPNLHPHWVHQTWTIDGQLSYDFTALLPVEAEPVPGYSKGEKEVVRAKDGTPLEKASAQTSKYNRSILDHLLRGTIITIGCNNILGQDPAEAFGQGGNGVGYPGFTYDATGRFVYGRLTQEF